MMELTDQQIERFSRQIILPEIGGKGQVLLGRSGAVLFGGGLLGRAAALYLVAAGWGRLRIVTHDRRAGDSLRSDLKNLNPDAAVDLSGRPGGPPQPTASPPGKCDVVLESTGLPINLQRANAVALAARVPLVAARVRGATGWLSSFAGHRAGQPCAACAGALQAGGDRGDPIAGLFATECSGAAGEEVLEPSTAVLLGALQALECIGIRLGISANRLGTARRYEAGELRVLEQTVTKRPRCPACARSGGG